MAHYIVAVESAGGPEVVAKRLAALGAETTHPLLSGVWYLKTPLSCEAIYEHVNSVLTANDRLLVVEATTATFRDLLTTSESLRHVWKDVA